MKKGFLQTESGKTAVAYARILFVVFVWGLAPLLTVYLLRYFSPSVYTALGGAISAAALTLICGKHLKKLNKDYWKIALPTGLCNGLAAVLQKIGLQYTTPAQYAFLETLSVVIVPFLSWLLVGRKPSVCKLISIVVCLSGAFVLSGMDFSGGGIRFGLGELLCAIAGLLYGVNIAVTGAYSKKIFAPLYIMIQMYVQAIVCLLTALLLNTITGADGLPLEPLVLPNSPWIYLLLALVVMVTDALCWVIRTNAMKRVDASVVAVVMPFSAVVTAVSSVIVGLDALTVNLAIGAALALAAVLLSTASDFKESAKARTQTE